MKFETTVKHLVNNRVLLFECPCNCAVSDNVLHEFISHIMSFVQDIYPCRGYNYFEECNRDMLSVIVVIDINNPPQDSETIKVEL